ncbi:hypothetical protein Q3G72_022942 [Acer saccharum]|nr:hypothetical protein Q3G72_022942 [Acer saccharum]
MCKKKGSPSLLRSPPSASISSRRELHICFNSLELSYKFPCHDKLLPSARLASSRREEDEDMEIVVVNEDTQEPLEDGIEGEIWVSSPSNASGYLGHPFLTRKIFHARLGNRTSPFFIRTGERNR